MHLKDEIQSELINNDVICHYIHKGITGVMQPLDVCVNKSFKDSLRKKYIDYCIDLKEIKNIKVSRKNILEWINEVWNSPLNIPNNLIEKSFLVTGLVNKESELNLCQVYFELKERLVIEEEDYIKSDIMEEIELCDDF